MTAFTGRTVTISPLRGALVKSVIAWAGRIVTLPVLAGTRHPGRRQRDMPTPLGR